MTLEESVQYLRQLADDEPSEVKKRLLLIADCLAQPERKAMNEPDLCQICGKPAETLSACPDLWPVLLPKHGGQGKSFIYHQSCVADAIALAKDNAALRAEVEALNEMGEAQTAKIQSLSAHGTCGCSYDRPDDLCMHHSPKLKATLEQLEQLKAVAAEMAALIRDTATPRALWLEETSHVLMRYEGLGGK